MSKLTPALSGLACFLWVSGWTWIFSEGKQKIPNSDNPIPFKVWLNNEQYQVQQPFVFDLGQAMPVMTEQLHPVLKELARNLQANPGNVLTITGIYSKEEQNETKFANLGLARASAVKALLTTAGADEGKVRIVGMESTNLLLVKEKLVGAVYFQFEKNGKHPIADATPVEEKIVNSTPNHSTFNFDFGEYKVKKQHLSDLNDLRRQLRDNPTLRILVSGYSSQEEEASSQKVDLAERRAMAIRRYLVDHGIRRAQISVKAKPGMAENDSEMVVTVEVTEN